MSLPPGLFLQVSIRRGNGAEAVLVAYGVVPLSSAFALDEACEAALAMLRKELARSALVRLAGDRGEAR